MVDPPMVWGVQPNSLTSGNNLNLSHISRKNDDKYEYLR